MKSLGDIERRYQISLMVHVCISLVLTFLILISSSESLVSVGYEPGFAVKFLSTLGGVGLLTGGIIWSLFLVYGVYQKISGRGNFDPMQFLTIFLAGAVVFGASFVAGYSLESQGEKVYVEKQEISKCLDRLDRRTFEGQETVNAPEGCLEDLKKVSAFQELEKGDKIRKTPEGYEIADAGS